MSKNPTFASTLPLRALLGLGLSLAVAAAHALPTINLTGSIYNGVASAPSGIITTSQGSVTFTNQPASRNHFFRLRQP